MPKRGDHIHKRADGRWEGRYPKGRKPNGTVLYGSVYGKSYQEVKDKLSMPYSDAKSTTRKNKELTFSDILALWINNNRIRLKGGTVNKYQNLIEIHIDPTIGKIKISELSFSVLNNFLSEKLRNGRVDGKGGLSPSYVKSIMLIINAAIQFAVEEGLCRPLKMPVLKSNKLKKEISVLSVAEQKQLEQTLRCNITPTKIGVLISLYTGLRIGEVNISVLSIRTF